MKKKFDCVEMKHRGADKIRRIVEGMTLEQQVAFWKERTEKMRKRRMTATEKERTSTIR